MGGTRFPAMVRGFTQEPYHQYRKQPWEKGRIPRLCHIISETILSPPTLIWRQCKHPGPRAQREAEKGAARPLIIRECDDASPIPSETNFPIPFEVHHLQSEMKRKKFHVKCTRLRFSPRGLSYNNTAAAERRPQNPCSPQVGR